MRIELDLREIDALEYALNDVTYNPSRFMNKERLKVLEGIKTKLSEYTKEITRSSVGRKGWKK